MPRRAATFEKRSVPPPNSSSRPEMTDLITSFVEVGAIQFGRFEAHNEPGTFAPIAINLRYIPSYPAILKALAAEIAPLVKIADPSCTHILSMSCMVQLGTTVSLLTEMPLVYA